MQLTLLPCYPKSTIYSKIVRKVGNTVISINVTINQKGTKMNKLMMMFGIAILGLMGIMGGIENDTMPMSTGLPVAALLSIFLLIIVSVIIRKEQ